MARKYTKTNGTTVSKKGASSEYSSPIPSDNRSVVARITDLTALETWVTNGVSAAYVGLPVYVEEDAHIYILTNEEYSNADNWKKIPNYGEVAGGTIYKGVTDNTTTLAAIANKQAGDMYYVTHAVASNDANVNTADGAFYIWNGSAWDKINKEDISHATLADTADELTTARKINGLSFKGNANVSNYFVCSTVNAGAYSATLTGIDTDTEGAEVRVMFSAASSVANPTFNGIPLKRGNTPYTNWKAGTVLTLTLTITGTAPDLVKEWQVHETDGIDIVADNFTKFDFTTLDFENDDQNHLAEGSQAPLPFGGAEPSDIMALFNAMFALGNNDDGKLHFIKFAGKRRKFDVNGTSSVESGGKIYKSVTFSFLYNDYKTVGDAQSAKLVTIKWTLNVTDSISTFVYKAVSLIGGTAGVTEADLQASTTITGLNTRLTNLENNSKWYTLT